MDDARFTDGDTIDVAAVEAHLRGDIAGGAGRGCVRAAYFQRSAEVLVDDGLAMVEFPQSTARMVPACQTAYE